MPDMDELLRGLQDIDPLWSVALVALALIVLLAARLWRASFGKALALGATFAVLAVVVGTAIYFYLHLEDIRRLEERRALEERAVTIFAQTMQPGTVFACLDGSPAPAMLEACERIIFMEPQRAAAAVAITTQRLAFLSDAIQFANKRDASYLARIESLRSSVESDAYGFVAYVMSLDHRCTPDFCERFQLLRDPSRVRENLRTRRFEAFMAKHGPAWREAAPAPAPVRESPLPPATARPSISSGVTIGDRAGASEIADPGTAVRVTPPPPPAPAVQPQVSIPAAATSPEVSAAEATPEPAAATTAAAESAPAAKSAQPAKAAPAAAAKSATPPAAPKAAAKPKAAASADPATKRTNEPVGGLPRVVPRDYIRDKEEQEAAPAQASGQPPGAPIQISPQQN
jgi:hypothetical protein